MNYSDSAVRGSLPLKTVSHADEVRQILQLQADNLPASLTPGEMTTQGFVTVRHDLAVLQRMNAAA